jgi:hypothetical protein
MQVLIEATKAIMRSHHHFFHPRNLQEVKAAQRNLSCSVPLTSEGLICDVLDFEDKAERRTKGIKSRTTTLLVSLKLPTVMANGLRRLCANASGRIEYYFFPQHTVDCSQHDVEAGDSNHGNVRQEGINERKASRYFSANTSHTKKI